MNYISIKHKFFCSKYSDIFEHLPTLCNYAKECESILLLSGDGNHAYWSMVHGLLHPSTFKTPPKGAVMSEQGDADCAFKMHNGVNNQQNNKKLILNAKYPYNVDELMNVTRHLKIDIQTIWKNSLDIDVSENIDMTFIDSWHIYGQMKRELDKFSPITNKYIIMHDTTVDEWEGETVRCGLNAEQQSRESGIPVDEIKKGVWFAIDEFLQSHPEWVLHERFTNNHGLTILKRIL